MLNGDKPSLKKRIFRVLRWTVAILIVLFLTGRLNPFYTFLTVTSDSMDPIFNAGDLVCVSQSVDSVSVGDIVAFRPPRGGKPIIHRIISIEGDTLITKGDACESQDVWFGGSVTKSDVFGKYLKVKIPKLGYVKELPGLIRSWVKASFVDTEKASGSIQAPLFTPAPTEDPMSQVTMVGRPIHARALHLVDQIGEGLLAPASMEAAESEVLQHELGRHPLSALSSEDARGHELQTVVLMELAGDGHGRIHPGGPERVRRHPAGLAVGTVGGEARSLPAARPRGQAKPTAQGLAPALEDQPLE